MARRPKTLADLQTAHKAAERAHILAAIKRNGWVLGAAARELGVPRSSLQRLLERHDLVEICAEHSRGPGRPPAKK